MASDVLQTAGVVTLDTTLTAQDSDTYSTSFTKTNSNGYVGTVNVALDVNDVTLEVVNTLTIGANGVERHRRFEQLYPNPDPGALDVDDDGCRIRGPCPSRLSSPPASERDGVASRPD